MHTPGPWIYEDRTGWISSEHCCHRGLIHVADIRGWGHLTGKGHGAHGMMPSEARAIQDANAKLIVAAPDLLAFAQAFMARWHQEAGSKPVSELRPLAQAAIAKATGSVGPDNLPEHQPKGENHA